MKKVLEQFFIIFIQENFYFSPESLIEAAETDPYAKESTRLIKRYVQGSMLYL